MEFKDIQDTPDLMLKAGTTIRFSFSYNWGLMERRKKDMITLPLDVHAKDFFKLRQNALRHAYAKCQADLGGTQPTLTDLTLHVWQ